MAHPLPESNTLPLADWNSLQTRLIWCYSGAVATRYRRGISTSENNAVWLLLQGSVRIRYRSMSLRAGKGQWIALPPGTGERNFSSDARIVSVSFRARWPDGRALFEERLPKLFDAQKHPLLRKLTLGLAHHVAHGFHPHDTTLGLARIDAAGAFALQSHFHAWLSLFAAILAAEKIVPTRMEINDDRVRHGLFFIERLATAQKFPKGDLARELGLSPSQLDRLFVQHMGITPKAHFEKLRQGEAQRLLAAKSLRVKEIAFRLGFRSASHFSMWFQRASGLSPRRYATSPGI